MLNKLVHSHTKLRWLLVTITIACLASLVFIPRKLFSKPKVERPHYWTIGILHGKDPAKLRTPSDIKNPVLTANSVTDRKVQYVADPLMVPYNGKWYMFFEMMDILLGRGVIGYASSPDAKNWKYEKTVLEEPFHLSFPFVFQDGDSYYMVPETRGAKSIRLYKADPFPDKWTFIKTIAEGSFADNTVMKHDGRWWMFSVEGPYSLSIRYADSPLEDWKEHPMSPLFKRDNSKTRPAGRFIEYDGKLIRFAQDSRDGYGHQVRAFVIDKLTTEEYEEHLLEPDPFLAPGHEPWKDVAMHTLDLWQLPNKYWIGPVDGNGY